MAEDHEAVTRLSCLSAQKRNSDQFRRLRHRANPVGDVAEDSPKTLKGQLAGAEYVMPRWTVSPSYRVEA